MPAGLAGRSGGRARRRATPAGPDGAVTGYSYDEAGELAVTTAPPVTAQEYGGPAVTVWPVTTTGYDTFGDVAETQDANGNVGPCP